MKKKWIISLSIALAVIVLLFASGIIVIDHSAQRGFENSVTWRGHTYVEYPYNEYHEGRTLAKTTDGLRINAVKEDPTHTFIVLRSFLDQFGICIEGPCELMPFEPT